MKLLSYEIAGRRSFGAVKDDGVVDLGARFGPGCGDLKALLEQGRVEEARGRVGTCAPDHPLTAVRYLPPILQPEKIVCIGVNYVDRSAEYRDGSDLPKYPSVFMRTPDSLVGHGEALRRPPESDQLDYEGEIAIVIGNAGRRIPEAEADCHIAGLSIVNEGTIRDWLRHGKFNVTQGKNFVASGSFGPWLVTADEFKTFDDLALTTRVNGEIRQQDGTSSLLFSFRYLVSYLSTFMLLKPGDVIATGTPTGVGVRFDPPRFLVPGDIVEIEVPGIGVLSNSVRDED